MDTAQHIPSPLFAEPTPMGLIGLAVGCAALAPIAFGLTLTPAALKTAAILCLLFGGGCQFLAGLMSLANKNLYGGTLFTAFAFNWVMNWWILTSIAGGVMPDHHVMLSVDICFLLIFGAMTYGFGFFSGLLFAFLLVIDLMYVFKIVAALTGTAALAMPIAALTVVLGLLALWIAFALLINPVAGRRLFWFPGPVYRAAPPPQKA
ncbi:MAG: acetate uptake transporter family protein [Elusimicrobiales bacterium]|nr:acetate uptake transporter family protein [Elusimicrobiales bacterium]